MIDIQNTDRKLNILEDLMRIAYDIENSIQGDFKGRSMIRISDDELDDYFVYQFLRKAISHAKSVILLAENQHTKEVVLITRTILEGWFYFKSFINVKSRATAKHRAKKCDDKNLSKKWRDFWIYEAFQHMRKQNGEAAAIVLLTELENTMGVNVVAEANREFDPFNEKIEKVKWHKRGTEYNLKFGNKLANIKRRAIELQTSQQRSLATELGIR